MEWVRERDLLIAQTLAFVQSVTARQLEAEADTRRRKASVRIDAPKIDALKISAVKIEAVQIDAIQIDATQIDAVKAAEPPANTRFGLQTPVAAPRASLSSDLRSEIEPGRKFSHAPAAVRPGTRGIFQCHVGQDAR